MAVSSVLRHSKTHGDESISSESSQDSQSSVTKIVASNISRSVSTPSFINHSFISLNDKNSSSVTDDDVTKNSVTEAQDEEHLRYETIEGQPTPDDNGDNYKLEESDSFRTIPEHELDKIIPRHVKIEDPGFLTRLWEALSDPISKCGYVGLAVFSLVLLAACIFGIKILATIAVSALISLAFCIIAHWIKKSF